MSFKNSKDLELNETMIMYKSQKIGQLRYVQNHFTVALRVNSIMSFQ